MKVILGMILGCAIAIAPMLAAQEPTPDKEKPRPEEPRGQQPNPKQQPPPNEKANAEKQEPAPKAQKDQQKAEQKQQQQQEKEKQKQAKQDEKAKDKNPNQSQGQAAPQSTRTQQTAQAANGKGQRIPPQKFQQSFGSEHHFHVRHLEDGRRFQYGGYWFEMVQVWPAGWSYDDDCYIDEDGDDYYLVDAFHPDTRVLVIVVEA